MTEKEAIEAATKRAQQDGFAIRSVEWVRYFTIKELGEDWKDPRVPFWVVRFLDYSDPRVAIEDGFSVFVYEADGTTEIPVAM
jgi:hypothetical protein